MKSLTELGKYITRNFTLVLLLLFFKKAFISTTRNTNNGQIERDNPQKNRNYSNSNNNKIPLSV